MGMKRNMKGQNKAMHQFNDNKNSPDQNFNDLNSMGSQPFATGMEESIDNSSQQSREILEPTLKNLKRMELKNQRKDMTTSLVTSQIDSILQKHGRKSAVVNMGGDSISQYSGNSQNF